MDVTDHLISALVSIAVAIGGIAALAIIVSRNANTSGVIGSAGGAFAGALAAAEAPVTGASVAFHVGNSSLGPGFYG